jgi:DNA-binding CsgD family transcriptional regulator
MSETEENVSDLLAKLYDAALDRQEWDVLLCDVADFCGGANAALVVSDPVGGYTNVVTPRADPDVVDAYTSRWWLHDPTATATAAAPVGHVTDLRHVDRDFYFSSAYYNDYWRTSGLGNERLAVRLLSDGAALSKFVVQAAPSRDFFDDGTARRFRMLIPHLMRVVEIGRRLRQVERATVAEFARPTGPARPGAVSVLVDEACRLVHVDGATEAALGRHPRLVLTRQGLRLKDQVADARLKRALHACARMNFGAGESLTITVGPAGGEAVTIEVAPYRAAMAGGLLDAPGSRKPVAWLIIRDPRAGRAARVETLRGRFGLTRAEAELAIEMLAGDGRQAAADRCGISINTARTHLIRIFDKTGVKRQAELIRLIMESGDATA